MEAHVLAFEERAHLPRVKAQTILMLAVLFVAVHVLLPQIGEFSHAVRAIERADYEWVIPALVMAGATYLFASVALIGASVRPLPLLTTSEAQLASSFANRLAPGSVGGLGVNVRFLQKQGCPTGEAGAALALNGLAGAIVHVNALLVAGIAARDDTRLHLPHPKHWEIAAAFAVIMAIAGIIWRLPRLRSHILPALTDAWHRLRAVVRRPKQAATLFAGAAGVTASYTACFLLCCVAFHLHISSAQAASVYLGGAVVSAAAPTPGGLGAMEAALVAGLTHIGVLDGRALAAVLTFRLLTFWLPILPGYFSLRHLRHAGLL